MAYVVNFSSFSERVNSLTFQKINFSIQFIFYPLELLYEKLCNKNCRLLRETKIQENYFCSVQ